jgi:hypothetical protein
MGREPLVVVELKDGTVCRMAKKAFNVFLAHHWISKFQRSGEWVYVGRDMFRDIEATFNFSGEDRREAV